MFEPARLIQSSFSLFFECRPTIRRELNRLEDLFRGHYTPPQVLGVPDELDPEIPRVLFGSRHGFSQIVVSEISLTLNVSYSPDWQRDWAKPRPYIEERIPLLFEAAQPLSPEGPLFCGLVNRAQLLMGPSGEESLGVLNRTLLGREPETELFDVELREVTVKDDKFFRNISRQTFRGWRLDAPAEPPVSLARAAAVQRGIQLLVDFNDRFAFNERPGYRSSRAAAAEILTGGFFEVGNQIRRLGGETT